jgi:hypothetical protein
MTMRGWDALGSALVVEELKVKSRAWKLPLELTSMYP